MPSSVQLDVIMPVIYVNTRLGGWVLEEARLGLNSALGWGYLTGAGAELGNLILLLGILNFYLGSNFINTLVYVSVSACITDFLDLIGQ